MFGYCHGNAVQVGTESPVVLNKEWRLVMNQFLSLDQVIEDTTSIAIDVPRVWNGVDWQGQAFSGIGYGTYFLHVELTRYLSTGNFVGEWVGAWEGKCL